MLRLLLSTALIVLCIGHAREIQAAEPPKLRLALNWKPEPQFGGFYAAETGGFYKKFGLNIELTPGGAGTPVVQMIAAKQMDFGLVSADEVVLSRSHGGDVVALFAAFQTNPQGIMAHAERGFRSLNDLFVSPGTLSLQKGLPYAMYLEKKFPNAKVQIVPYLGGITNYIRDPNFSQQCFVTSEPLAAEKKKIKTKTFLVADEGYNPYTTVLITRAEVIVKNPKLVKALVDAVRSGWREYIDHPEAANKWMSDLNKAMLAETFKESSAAQTYLIETDETKKNGLGTMTEARWKTLVQQMVELKLIPKPLDAKSLFTNL